MRHIYLAIIAVLALSMAATQALRAGSPPDAAANSADVNGTVKLEGTAPKLTHINMSADPACAKSHPGGATVQDIAADANGGLENVVVFVVDGLGNKTFDPPSQPAVMEQKGCMYQPHVVAMQTNQKLEVVNDDSTIHNIHPLPLNNREWNKAQAPGTRVDMTFAREEIAIPMKCNVHPWMRSYIAVFKHPYFAVSTENGSFDLKNLPPGNYTVQAWHEKLGTLTQKVTVGPGETKTLDLVFKAKPGM